MATHESTKNNNQDKRSSSYHYKEFSDNWEHFKQNLTHAAHDVKCAGHSLCVVAKESSEGWRKTLKKKTKVMAQDILRDISVQSKKLKEYLTDEESTLVDLSTVEVGDRVHLDLRDSLITHVTGIVEDIDLSSKTIKVVSLEDERLGTGNITFELRTTQVVRFKILDY